MDDVEFLLPTFNTALIGLGGLCLLIGWLAIRRKAVEVHRRFMLSATVFSALFLIVYVTRALLFEAKIFAGEGLARLFYLAVLGSHSVLAIVVAPLALWTISLALRGQFQRHRRIARVTLPIWAYVVVTGWTIYLMLYVLFP